jgi:hypothetical protein
MNSNQGLESKDQCCNGSFLFRRRRRRRCLGVKRGMRSKRFRCGWWMVDNGVEKSNHVYSRTDCTENAVRDWTVVVDVIRRERFLRGNAF